MLIACWSVKGGVGTTAVAAAIAVSAAHHGPVLAVDLAGDLPGCLGVAESVGPGVSEWLAAGAEVPPDALHRMQDPVAVNLSLLARGRGPQPAHRARALVQLLAATGGTVVVDCGRLDGDHPVAVTVAAEADRSLLVTRLCFLGLRRAAQAPLRPSGVVVIREPGRALTVADAERTIGAPVVADVMIDPAVGRAIDAGLLTSRLPRSLAQMMTLVAA
ncbi:MAG: hypothetical protein ABI239_00835 [Aquihabitans sp.]